LSRYYRPHHASLTRAVEAQLIAFGRSLLIDAHSFPSEPRSYELDQNLQRSDICLGSDSFHTPSSVLECAATIYERAGYTVAFNTPYAGTLVPLAFYRNDERVMSIMVEVNRRLYMNERTGQPLGEFETVRDRITQACREMIRCCLV
jgi:N-formylglutamate amidohydrolase